MKVATESSPLERIGQLESELVALRALLAGADAAGSRAAVPARVGSGPRQLLLCRSGPDLLALDLEDIAEVIPMAALKPLPDAEPWMLGSLNLRGTPIPVVDLASRVCGESDPLSRNDLILVCRAAGGLHGLRVRDALDVVTRPVAPVGAHAASARARGFVAGMIVEDADQIMVLDVNRLVASSVSDART